MSEMHANFLINTGGATAADLEGLGEEVRKRVLENSGISLEWEIMRVGEPGVHLTKHELTRHGSTRAAITKRGAKPRKRGKAPHEADLAGMSSRTAPRWRF
jgi:hypothetical protein